MPLEVEVAGEQSSFEGAKQRRLFALLALRAPDVVSADELAEALWGTRIPGGVVQAQRFAGGVSVLRLGSRLP